MAATFEDAQFQDLVTMAKDLGLPIPADIMVEASNVPRKREIIKRMEAAQQGAVAKPAQKIVQSLNFKDLPPDGQAQMAAEVGIQLNPQALAVHAAQQGAPAGPPGSLQVPAPAPVVPPHVNPQTVPQLTGHEAVQAIPRPGQGPGAPQPRIPGLAG